MELLEREPFLRTLTTDPALEGVAVKALHIEELRSALR